MMDIAALLPDVAEEAAAAPTCSYPEAHEPERLMQYMGGEED
jgi:hypothetical protein